MDPIQQRLDTYTRNAQTLADADRALADALEAVDRARALRDSAARLEGATARPMGWTENMAELRRLHDAGGATINIRSVLSPQEAPFLGILVKATPTQVQLHTERGLMAFHLEPRPYRRRLLTGLGVGPWSLYRIDIADLGGAS